MRGSSVQDHDDEFPGMRVPNLVEKAIHVLGIHGRCGQIIETAILRADGGIFVHKLTDQRQTDHRPAWDGRPVFSHITHSPESRFIVKHQTD